jgi:predicted NAD-dependent protein-ADP-ribosyltransferase YbiA (DUF1768 family)
MENKVVISFTKVELPYGWLGNMSPFKVNYDGKEWLTVEALFQALRYDDESIREIIRSQKSPMGAKMKAKSFKERMVVIPTSEKDLENMKMCVRLKVDQNSIIKEKILRTKEFEIIEDVANRPGERHLFWGAKKVNGEWEGQNMMGKIWMEIRKELKKEETNS